MTILIRFFILLITLLTRLIISAIFAVMVSFLLLAIGGGLLGLDDPDPFFIPLAIVLGFLFFWVWAIGGLRGLIDELRGLSGGSSSGGSGSSSGRSSTSCGSGCSSSCGGGCGGGD